MQVALFCRDVETTGSEVAPGLLGVIFREIHAALRPIRIGISMHALERQDGWVILLVYVLVLIAVAVPIYWLEAAWGRAKLRDCVAREGWTLVEVHWRPAFRSAKPDSP